MKIVLSLIMKYPKIATRSSIPPLALLVPKIITTRTRVKRSTRKMSITIILLPRTIVIVTRKITTRASRMMKINLFLTLMTIVMIMVVVVDQINLELLYGKRLKMPFLFE